MSVQTLRQFQEQYQEYAKLNVFNQKPKGLYEPVDYILNLGGKQLRPILLLISHYLFNDNLEKAFPAAYSIEIFHNFTLLHDDIMDNAPLRRGKPTVHEVYNTNTAILSGDVMLIYAYQFLVKAGTSENLAQLIEFFNEAAIKVCEGQQYDMDFEQRNDVTIPEYLLMIEYKTAALLESAMKIGAVIAETSPENTYHISAFARNIGIAFQLQDDILDTFGDPKKFGKKVGGDIAQNKKTFLILKALEIADSVQRELLHSLYFGTAIDEKVKIAAVIDIFNELNIKRIAEERKKTYQNIAFEHLAQVKTTKEKKRLLTNLAESLLVRQK